MKTMMFSEIDMFEIRRVADRYQLDLIVLFGSYAKGTFHPSSDMDIAVHCVCASKPVLTTRKDYPPPAPPKRGAYAMRDNDSEAFWEMELFDDLNAVLKAPEGIDLVVLNRANSTLLYEVARYGIPIYQREKDTFHQFRSYAARRFYDDAKFRRLSWEYLKRRCLNGERDV